ncbi:MAG: hypothetical protein IKP88_15260 [Lachnospiraceae bacterium]|nr:hypothetical protein [Lachnospiraceae bacterium]
MLSRKGFDSSFGGCPSPILPDGTLVSMPIPGLPWDYKYSDLSFPGGGTYFDAWNMLKPNGEKIQNCHLDPDIRLGLRDVPDDWKPAFGQCDQAQTHLMNNKVKKGDLFLFFGWFRQTEYKDGKLKFVKGAPDIHVIYGYLQIGEILTGKDLQKCYWHPHAHNTGKNNTIYVASDSLVIDGKDTGLPGAGTFTFSEELNLTAPGQCHSRWKLIEVLRNKNIGLTYHDKDICIKDGYFQSVARGQEFVFSESRIVNDWAKHLIMVNYYFDDTDFKIEKLLNTECWIIDILPKRVSKERAGQYAALERELLHTDEFRVKLFQVLLKLNCYYGFKAILPDGEEIDDISGERLKELVGYRYIQILIGDSLIVSDPDDMYMSLFNPPDNMLELVTKIAESEGMFVWKA